MSRLRITWPLSSQILSSGTNFAPVVVVAHARGPAEVGILGFGLTVAAFATLVTRANVGEPFLASWATGRAPAEAIIAATRKTAIIGLAGLGFGGVLGLALGGNLGQIAALTGLAIPFSSRVEAFRYLSFQQDGGRRAVQLDAVWLATTTVLLILAWRIGRLDQYTGVLAWGVGAAVATSSCRLRALTRLSSHARGHLRDRGLSTLGRWLLGQAIISALGAQLFQIVIERTLGPETLGGYRASLTLIAPLLVVSSALLNAALISPAGPRRVGAPGRRRTLLLAAGVLGSAAAFLALGEQIGRLALRLVFGATYEAFAPMLLWILVGVAFQLAAVIAAAGLRTAGKGRALFTSQALASGLGFTALLVWIAADDLLAPGKAYLVQTAAISIAMWVIWRKSLAGMSSAVREGHPPPTGP